MLTQEKRKQSFTQIPNAEKPPKMPFIFPKKAFFVLFFILLGVGLGIYAVFQNQDFEDYWIFKITAKPHKGV